MLWPFWGYSIVWLITDTPVGNFLGQIGKAVTGVDIIVGIVKGICFGMAITATCLYQGFKVESISPEFP